jgi:hypothetical protein
MGSVIELHLSDLQALSRISEFSKGPAGSANFHGFDSRLTRTGPTQATDLLLLGNRDGVVIGNSIDEFVVRIDAGACRHLVHDNLKGLVRLCNLFLL